MNKKEISNKLKEIKANIYQIHIPDKISFIYPHSKTGYNLPLDKKYVEQVSNDLTKAYDGISELIEEIENVEKNK